MLKKLLLVLCTVLSLAQAKNNVDTTKQTTNLIDTSKQPQLLDRVVAVVQDKAIMLSDLEQRINKMNTSNISIPIDFKQQVLESLIIENLQLQRALQMGISINDEQLALAIQNIAKNNGLESVDELIRRIEQQGGDFAEFRENIRKDFTIRQASMADIQSEIQVTDNEIKEFLGSKEGKELIEPAFHLGHIFIPNDSKENTEKTAELAEELTRKLRQSDTDFKKVAQQYSKSATVQENGGDLSWKKSSELPEFFVEHAKKMHKGEVSNPIVKSNGFHILKLFDSQGIHPEIKQEFKVRHILIKPSAIQTEQEAKEIILNLRQRIMQGEKFATLAKEYSADKFSGSDGGNLDWLTLSDVAEEFATAVAKLPMNKLSDPVKTGFGWHLIEVLDKRTEDITANMRKQMAYEFLANQKYSRELQSWIQKLRDTASIEIKLDDA